MNKALYLNGVFEDVLQEIIMAQSKTPGLVCHLQPYKSDAIRLLKDISPTEENKVTCYISDTKSLDVIRYVGDIVGWEDKRDLAKNEARLELLNRHMGKYQPSEKRIYLYIDVEKTKECVNLISVKNLRRVETPFSVTTLIKVSDGRPHKVRKQSGGWTPVYELPSWMEASQIAVGVQLEAELEERISESKRLSAEDRRKRLEQASPKPVPIQIISRGFRRNPDVIVEVLQRAQGKCEYCNSDAPFFRAKDGSPYLEIHHRKPLSEGGNDTVDNAIAVCPNCHMELHYGLIDADA
jgi:5-methylcytosine-specific restriction enzyme A